MRLKSADGPLAVHNGNNDLLNSPKRINTLQNSNYTAHQTTATSNFYKNVTNDVTKVTRNIQQLTIEEVAVLNNVHNDTQELRWCNSELTTGQDQQLHYQRQLALDNLANNRININSNLAARLRLRAQAAPPYGGEAPASPDDVPIDEDEAQQSCSSSVSASPQDEDRAFDPSDSADSSDDGNDYTANPEEVRPAKLRGIVNPNYPGFQHLAHTLDDGFDDENLNSANNNNEEFDVIDKFDSVNRLDSVENIQKVFHDKSVLDIEVDRNFPKDPEIDRDSPNSTSTNDPASESVSDTSATSDDSGRTVNENFNIKLEEKVFDIAELGDSKNKICEGSGDGGATSAGSGEKVKENFNIRLEEKVVESVVGDFRKEIEDELGRVCNKEHFEDPYEPQVTKATEAELEEAVEKLQVISDLQPSAAKYSIQPNTDQPFNKESPTIADHPIVLEDTKMIKSPVAINNREEISVEDEIMTKKASMSLNLKQLENQSDKTIADLDSSQPMILRDSNLIQTTMVLLNQDKPMELGEIKKMKDHDLLTKNVESSIPNYNSMSNNQKIIKNFALSLQQNKSTLSDVSRSAKMPLSPIENKMADALLSNAQEPVPKGVEKPSFDAKKIMSVDPNLNVKLMEIDDGFRKADFGRRDSNRELEEIEIQIKKIKSDTMCEMDDLEKFRKEDFTKDFKEKDEDSCVLRKKEKLNTYVKKRRDYNQQFGSLITFPKREPMKRDPLNRRSVPMIRDKKRIANTESLGGFDVYNIETAMPKIDLEAIECHLRAAREEERRVSYFQNNLLSC